MSPLQPFGAWMVMDDHHGGLSSQVGQMPSWFGTGSDRSIPSLGTKVRMDGIGRCRRSKDKLRFISPCARLGWVRLFKQQGRSK